MTDTVIVSGSNGFIGSALIKTLSAKCRKIYAIVKDENENISAFNGLNNVEVVYCDMAEFETLPSKINEKADVFYHFAWVGVSGDGHKSLDAQLNNVKYAVSAVTAAKKLGCRDFVFASSITERECETLLKSEKVPSAACYYSVCKNCAAGVVKILVNEYGMNYYQAVITNIYGVGDYSNRFLNANLKKIIRGEDTAFTSGDQTYDFIYIDDAAEILGMLPDKGVRNKSYYIGSGNPRPVKEFFYEMEEVTKPTKPLGIGKVAFNGVSLNYQEEFDVGAVERDLGYKPKTDFKEGIAKTYEWLKSLQK